MTLPQQGDGKFARGLVERYEHAEAESHPEARPNWQARSTQPVCRNFSPDVATQWGPKTRIVDIRSLGFEGTLPERLPLITRWSLYLMSEFARPGSVPVRHRKARWQRLFGREGPAGLGEEFPPFSWRRARREGRT